MTARSPSRISPDARIPARVEGRGRAKPPSCLWTATSRNASRRVGDRFLGARAAPDAAGYVRNTYPPDIAASVENSDIMGHRVGP